MCLIVCINFVIEIYYILVVVSLVKLNYFLCDDCDEYDDGGALIKSLFKHVQTNLRNYQRCHALRHIGSIFAKGS